MRTAVLVIAAEVFRDEEYEEPKSVLESCGVTVTTASTRPGTCTGKLGMLAEATLSVADAADREWDIVAFIGGAGAQVFFDDPNAHALARKAADSGRVVGAICIAPSTLARAGLLEGVRATAFPSQETDLRAHGAVWTGEAVTVDGRLVTGNGPAAASEFGRALCALLDT
jgi:protease I